jgi:hypothetical protein
MTRRVVCIARLLGAGVDELGPEVASALGYRLADEEIIQRAAETEGISVDELEGVERRRGFMHRMLENLAVGAGADGYLTGVPSATVPLAPIHDPRSLRVLIQQSIHETADEGDVVIVSHAASYALRNRSDVLRVMVTAPHDTRVARVGATQSLSAKDASKEVDRDDAGRATYLKQFYDVHREQWSDYDLVLNSARLPADVLCRVICSAAQAG